MLDELAEAFSYVKAFPLVGKVGNSLCELVG